MNGQHVYEARYGLTGRTLLHMVIAAAFVLAAVFVPMPLALRIACGGFFGVGLIVLALMVLSMRRKIALSVDPSGITLGGLPFRHARTTMAVPWQSIAAVVLFEQQTGMAKMRYIGLRGQAPLQDPGAPRGETLRRINAALVPHTPGDVVLASRPVNGWTLDRDRLTAAIQANAPHVQLHVVE